MGNKSGVSSDVISTPQGGGAIQGIGESFSPDLHTGTGNFTVPLDLPAGRNDFQPELNLVYSTGQGNSEFGMGWNLSVPGVTRKTSKGIPQYRDRAKDLDEWDTFILSGAEDLVPVAVWEYRGSDQDELVKNVSPTKEDFAAAPVVQFRPRTEGLFARIHYHRNGRNDYWKVESKDGLVSYYGTPPPDNASADWEDSAVIADPERKDNVFSWKLTETRDPFGNRIIYDYERDRPPSGERSWNQLYLKRIRYVDYGDPADPDFLVSVNFDYEDRPDSFSSYRAGFEIRTRKRCTRIAIKTHADKDRLFKIYDLTYLDERDDLDDLEDRLPLNGASLLSEIQAVGHDGDEKQALPPLEFSHTQFQPREREFFPVGGAELPARSLSSPDLALTDLFGNGLPDIIEMNGTVRYWRNVGQGKFERPRFMKQAPAGLTLADPDVQLLDADGDGRADLMAHRNGLSGYFPLNFNGEWSQEGFRRYDRAPSFNLQDPEVQLVDLDGDGVTDAIRSGARFECYFNDPDEGWDETRRVRRRSLEEFPNVDFSDPRVRFADMNGDGLQDIVLVHDGNVEYWPNLGHGDWGPRIHMERSPRFEYGYDPERILIGDVDGDGVADLVYVDDNRVTLWMNQSGNGWGDPLEIDGTPSVTDMDAVRLVDLLGTGVAGILWSANAGSNGTARDHTFFLDFTGGTKPYLLSEMDNNLGAVTRVEYASSTEYLLADQEDSETAWQTPLPFPVQVVARVEAVDAISGSKQTTEYKYHHGYWDGAEREFRGFGMVEQFDTETFADYNAPGLHGEDVEFKKVKDKEQFSPPTLTKTWFHQGAVGPEHGAWHEADNSAEYWSDQLLGEATKLKTYLKDADEPRRAKRDAVRALRGRALRKELYALDGSGWEDRPYTVTEHAHDVRPESVPDIVDAERRVFFPHTVAERTTQWERGEDPLTTVGFTGDFDEHGQPRHQTQVALPRRSKKRTGIDVVERGQLNGDEVNETRILTTHTRTEYAEPQGTSYIHDRVAQERTFELQNPPTVNESEPGALNQVLNDQMSAARNVHQTFRDKLSTWQSNRPLPSAVQIIGHKVNHYDGSAFNGLPPGRVKEHGALMRSEALVFRNGQLDDIYSNRRPAYLDGPANPPVGAPGDFGQDLGYRRKQDSDPEYHAGYYADTTRRRYDVQDTTSAGERGLVTAIEDPLKHRTEIESDQYGLLPKTVTDPVGLKRKAEYDYRVLKPKSVTDPNGHSTHLRYTSLGQVGKRFVKSRSGTGGTGQKPEVRYEYDFRAYERTREQEDSQPIFVHTTRRVHHASESGSNETIESREYSDGFGRLIQKRVQAPELVFGSRSFRDDVGLPRDPDASPTLASGQRDANRVAVSGWKVYDNKGRVVEKYEPFFDSDWAYQPEDDARQGKRVTQYYDPRGRVIRTVNPDGSEERVIFGIPESLSAPEPYEPTPWESYTYDANDNAGRTHLPNVDLSAIQHHHNTPTHEIRDALGRTIGTVERNRAPGQSPGPIERHFTQSRYDIRGNVLEITDPLGRSAFQYKYDLLDNPLSTDSIDAGLKTVVQDAAGNPVEARDSKGSVVLHEHDELNRPTRLWARDDAESRVTMREKLQYGDNYADLDDLDESTARQRNLLGRPCKHYDEAGLLRFDHYDFKGNVTKKTRRVVSDRALSGGWTADWDAEDADEEVEDEADGYVTNTSYDALGRPTEMRYPADVDGERVVLEPTYDRAGRLEKVDLGDTTYVEQIAYNARGQRKLIVYGNNVMTRYAYDPETFRLARLLSEKHLDPASTEADTWEGTGAPLQDFAYSYDFVGNILSIDDRTPDSGIPNTINGRNRLMRTFEYDPLYRLTKATGREYDRPNSNADPWNDAPTPVDVTRARAYTRDYRYDQADNLKQVKHTATRRNGRSADFKRRLRVEAATNRMDTVQIGQDTYSYHYDDNGNLGLENTARHFGWDHADRMRNFRVQTESDDPTQEAHYLYDASGKRVKKLVKKNSKTKSTTYIDGVFEHHEWKRNGSTEHANNRVHVMDDQKRIAQVLRGDPHPDDSRPHVQYHLGDHLGSSNVVVDEHGQQVNREECFPYGETSFGSFAKKRYRFTGKERDAESGLYYHGARYYAPWLGRWITCDRLGPLDGPNTYVYAANSPTVFVDNDGYQSRRAQSDDSSSDEESPTPILNMVTAKHDLKIAGIEAGAGVASKAEEVAAESEQKRTAERIDELQDDTLRLEGFTGKQLGEMERDIERITGLDVGIEKDFFFMVTRGASLTIKGTASNYEKGSPKARRILLSNISDSGLTIEERQSVRTDQYGNYDSGGLYDHPVVFAERMQDRIIVDLRDLGHISGKSRVKKSHSVGMVLFHELVHRSHPGWKDPDGKGTGPVVDEVNVMRKQLGLPTRSRYNSIGTAKTQSFIYETRSGKESKLTFSPKEVKKH